MATPLTLTRADVAAWADLFPAVPAGLERVVMHWSGGLPQPNAIGRRAYHALITGPHGWVERGTYDLKANVAPLARNYAQHVGGLNTGSAGVSWCGMRGSNADAGTLGPYPITATQMHRGLAFAAFLAARHGLNPADPAHLFTHREAWEIHRVRGTQNDTKLDWVVIPHDPTLRGWRDCGIWMRHTAATYAAQLALLTAAPKPLPPRPAPSVAPVRTWVRTRTALRVRPEPSTRRAPLASLPAGALVVVDAATRDGESVSGNRTWYRDLDGRWIWSGGTDRPTLT